MSRTRHFLNTREKRKKWLLIQIARSVAQERPQLAAWLGEEATEPPDRGEGNPRAKTRAIQQEVEG